MTTDRELADAYGLIVDLKARIEALERALKAAKPYVALYTDDPSLSNTPNETWVLIQAALRGEEKT